ncbi:MAG: orotidine-5'-phosphate decarboxylase [Schleiferiaceae bacterium]|jgi:orotidine-5'-phosphate decarboxylase|nr:orotidine-5'-phosphate decarboxylase [Flavobacteriaceae bacterium]MDP4759974.1 orotidine-5'-phosphate decarboxylase [Schleiferiaceae bacterium]MDP4768121.1 orotidine-5'-phosphate decarboxylase [Schleiferiaceae bacterium]MDP4877775.1 orotidine-5'-phosphate decarboxylase [Schleiferiaceae bacterium]
MNREALIEQIRAKRSVLCVGLDTDLEKIPAHLLHEEDPVFTFNKAIIDATAASTVAYKPNIAFYESMGVKGWQSLEKTIQYLDERYPEIFTIADAKRGDIGNTSKMYAKAFFENMNFDSVTVAPYMGEDSVTPFLEFPNKWVILLGLTSNKGAFDFQFIENAEGEALFESVVKKAQEWATADQLMFVLGATKTEHLARLRSIAPDHFFLVPGVGAQGGSLEEVLKQATNKDFGVLVNSTRGIIYQSNGLDFAQAAGSAARTLQQEMERLLF